MRTLGATCQIMLDVAKEMFRRKYIALKALCKMRNRICKWNKHLALKVRVRHENGNPNLIQRKQLSLMVKVGFQNQVTLILSSGSATHQL